MRLHDGAAVTIFGADRSADYAVRGEGRLISLREDGAHDPGLGNAFHVWIGRSGRRHVMSVYPVDRDAADLGLPDFTECVLLLVRTRGEVRCLLDVVAIEYERDLCRIQRETRAGATDQWHFYLLGETREARAAIVADLATRHNGERVALSA